MLFLFPKHPAIVHADHFFCNPVILPKSINRFGAARKRSVVVDDQVATNRQLGVEIPQDHIGRLVVVAIEPQYREICDPWGQTRNRIF